MKLRTSSPAPTHSKTASATSATTIGVGERRGDVRFALRFGAMAPRRADREYNPEDHRRCDRGRQYRCRDGDLTRAWHIRGDDEHDELNHPVGERGARRAARR